MRALRIVILAALSLPLFVGCNESTSAPASNKASSTNPTTTASEPVNLGPTGASDPITGDDVNMEEEVTFYDQADPSDEPELPGTPYNSCGVVYRQFNNPTIFFRNENNQTYNLKEFSYDSVTFLRNVRFKSDSFQVCLEGYRNGGDVFLNIITQNQATTHPLKLHTGQYSYEFCGRMAYITNFSGQTSLNLHVAPYDYLITIGNEMLELPAVIPTATSTLTEQNSIEACLYSNKASFKDYSVSYKPQFEIEAFDFGALNP